MARPLPIRANIPRRMSSGERPRNERARRALKWAAVASGIAALAAACSRNTDASFPHRSSLLDTQGSRLAFKSPAIWRYHPRKAAPLLARADLGGGSLLYAGEQGERWVFDKKAGSVNAAARLAPEAIVAILKIEGGAWLFVGESGTGYEAREPLGGFVRASVPLDRLARVSAATSAVVGVTRDGQIVRSGDAGASWKPVGAPDVRYVDVALVEGGHGVALSVPEAMWETKDDGASWKKLDVPSMGALSLAWDDVAGITVDTALGFKRWLPEKPTELPALGRTPKKGRFQLGLKPARGPDANALLEGRAIVVNGEYIEATSKSSSDSSWTLWRGRVAGRLRERAFPAAKGCKAVRLAAFDKYFYFACSVSSSGANQKFKIFRSENRGKKFVEETYNVEGRLAYLNLAVGAEGALSVTGICAPHDSMRGCSPYGIFHRRLAPLDAGVDDKKGDSKKDDKKDDKKDPTDASKKKSDGPEYELSPAATPALKGSALALAFAPDGHTAFAVGRRTKGSSLAVFVSHDGGQSFEGREIDQLDAEPESDSESRYSRPPPSPISNVTSISPGEDGTLALVLEGTPPTLVVVDEEGRVIAFSSAPPAATSLGAVGTRALAISSNQSTAWESLDGGATWTSIGKLPSGSPAKSQSSPDRVFCHSSGCVVGTELSRIGWRGQADDDQGVLSPVDSTAGDLYDRSVRTPLSCATDEKTWQPLPKVTSVPDAKHAAMGKAVWYAMAQDDLKASSVIYQATGGNRARVENVQLLSPVTKPQSYAYTTSYQVEGAAALRYPVDSSTSLKNLEVVWDNLFEGKVYRVRVADAGPAGVNDFTRTGFGAQRAQPAMLSIAAGGLYLRPHGGARDGQSTLFLDGRGVSTLPPVNWGQINTGSQSEMVHIGTAHVAVSFLPSGAGIVRGRREGSTWALDAYSTGIKEFWRFGLSQDHDLAYAPGNHAAIRVSIYEVEGTRHSSWLFPFRASGAVVDAPIPTPMQRDTGEKPNRCGGVTRADTPRVVSPFQGGTRHPIIVSDPVEPLRLLLTSDAVMHGSPSEPCVAAFDAEVVALDPTIGTPEQERAILPLDDLEHSWIFRTTYDSSGEAVIEYRLMSCRFDGGIEIPPETFSAPGTRVRRAR